MRASRPSPSDERPECPSPPSTVEALARIVTAKFGVVVDPTRLAIFVLCAWRGNGAAAELEELFAEWDEAQWLKLKRLSESEMMLSWVCHRLSKDRLSCPDSVFDDIQESACHRRRWNRVIGLAAVDVIEKLHRGGIKAMILKGAPLGVLAYGAPELRDVKDIDVLVSPDDVAAAGEILHSSGYQCEVDRAWLAQEQTLKSLRQLSFRTMGGALEIDLHWKLSDEWIHAKANTIDVHSDSTSITVFGRSVDWMGLPMATEAAEVNIAGSHVVELKATVDYVRLFELLSSATRGTPPPNSSDARIFTSQIFGWIALAQKACRLPAATVVRELLAYRNGTPERAEIWLRHLRRVRTFSELQAIFRLMLYPNKETLKYESSQTSKTALFFKTITRKMSTRHK